MCIYQVKATHPSCQGNLFPAPLKGFHSQTSLHVTGKMHGRGRPSPDLTASGFLKIAPPPKVLSRQLSFHSARFPFFNTMSMSVLPLHGYLLPRSSLEHGGSSLLRTEQCHKVFEEPLRIFFYSKTHYMFYTSGTRSPGRLIFIFSRRPLVRGLALSHSWSQRFPHHHPLLELRAICPELSWHLHEVRTLPMAQTIATFQRAATAAAEVPN